MLLYGHDKAVSDFVSTLLFHDERGFGNCRAIGVLDTTGALISGVVYHNWQPEAQTIEMSCASTNPRWLNRIVLDEIFRYPFERVGCQMVLMRVSERNKRLHRQFDVLGLRRLGVPRLYGRNEGGIIFTLTDDDWLAGRFKRRDVQGQSTDTPRSDADGCGADG